MKINDSTYFNITKNDNDIIEGDLTVAIAFLDDNKVKIGFCSELINKYVVDEFKIRINLSKNIPLVYEIGGRIDQISKKLHNKKDKLHINQDGDCCLAPSPFLLKFLDTHPSLSEFIESVVIPFFGGLSFLEKKGHRPNKEYSHGGLGLLEYFFELSDPEKIENINYFNLNNLHNLKNDKSKLYKKFIVFLAQNKQKTPIQYFLINLGLNPDKLK